jgi:hypothetical protein
VPSIGNHRRMKRDIGWLGIVRTVLVQVLVLLALAGVVVWYLDWSSEAAWNDFIGAGKFPVSSPDRQPQSSAPVQIIKAKAACVRRA